MALHFTQQEFDARLTAARAKLVELNLDGILLFAPESHYYLTGYDTFGFAMFQCMVLPADGAVQLLTRAPDLRQAQQTSILRDEQIHIWADDEDAAPARQLVRLLADIGLRGARLGIETNTAGLNAFNGRAVFDALDGAGGGVGGAELVEASEV
ncbi:MAG: aminopeptidase P family N-terminal domain-containing protein, partial [bacterium]